MVEEIIDDTKTQAFFYGSSIRNPKRCGAGGFCIYPGSIGLVSKLGYDKVNIIL